MAHLDGTKIAAGVLGGLVVALVSSLVTASVIGSDHPGRAEVLATVDRAVEPVSEHIALIYTQLATIDGKVDELIKTVAASK